MLSNSRYRYPIVRQPQPRQTNWKLWAGIIGCIVILLIIGAIALALGLGLGLGLRKSSDSSSSSSSSTSVLSAPSVSCTYGGSATCGCASIQPSFASSRIINGYSAVANSWPWTIILYYNNAQRCGGFLVTYQHVVTAAHCVYGLTPSSIQIYAGVHSLSSSPYKQYRTVTSMQVHPSYDSSKYTNDIAVLKLASSFNTTAYVGLCCLTSDTSLPATGDNAVIVGWGTTSTSSIVIPDTLQQAVIQVKSASSCGITSTSNIQFCAGYTNTDTCQGDSGGPLMTAVNNSWTCTGVVSSGVGCTGSGFYTRVSYYRSFISTYVASL
ncbi:unnamed protein product [Adineta ricciae]|uniref:Peptidase S1 domain-containing protein n=1 Tax=Adineta ricciae TaxID=249248 RepID=A0A813QQ44_ADIRI|nr:unnamed protein product [Adineta ricciae]CAF1563314.1 unnamed protein product [Adineta ricciae]